MLLDDNKSWFFGFVKNFEWKSYISTYVAKSNLSNSNYDNFFLIVLATNELQTEKIKKKYSVFFSGSRFFPHTAG